MYVDRNKTCLRLAAGLLFCLTLSSAVAPHNISPTRFQEAQLRRALVDIFPGAGSAIIGRPLTSGLWRAEGESLAELMDRLTSRQDLFQMGVYVPGVMALPVIRQPEDNSLFVSAKSSVLTQFSEAAANGILGILAHNFLAGGLFYNIDLGQDIWIIEGVNEFKHYKVSRIEQYQRIHNTNAPDEYIDLTTNEELSTPEVFARYYAGEHRLTLQTCLEKDGDGDWGLTFIVADLIP